MRKVLGYVSIFILGGILAVTFIRMTGRLSQAPEEQQRQNVLHILNRPPASTTVEENAIIRAAALITPSVVNIDTVEERRAGGVDFFGNPWERSYTLQGKGSGVIISPDGYIVTNSHVVQGANIIRVTMVNGKKYDGRLIGADPEADIAVIKVDGSRLPTAELGDSTRLRVGQYVLAIGYPLGIGTTVTHGIISATDRHNLQIGEGRILSRAIQTDAPINRGNSGGALANLRGQLIGINTAIASENGGGNIGIGFAIPIDAARDILRNLIAQGRSKPPPPAEPFIGIVYGPLNPDIAEEYNLPPGQGVVISEVKPLTPAADAGLHQGDIIVSVDGKPVNGVDDIRNSLIRRRVGERVTLQLLRGDGSRENVSITLGRKPDRLGPR